MNTEVLPYWEPEKYATNTQEEYENKEFGLLHKRRILKCLTVPDVNSVLWMRSRKLGLNEAKKTSTRRRTCGEIEVNLSSGSCRSFGQIRRQILLVPPLCLRTLEDQPDGFKNTIDDLILDAVESGRNLLCSSPISSVHDFVEQGLVKEFFKYLHEDLSKEIHYNVLWALTNMASEIPSSSSTIMNPNSLSKILSFLSSPHLPLVEKAVCLLGNLAGHGDSNRRKLQRAGVIPLFVNCVRPNRSATFLRHVSFAISNMCRFDVTILPKTEIELFLPVILFFLRHEDRSLVADACWTLSYVTSPMETHNRFDLIDMPDVLAFLVEQMRIGDPPIAVPAARVCTYVSQYSRVQAEALMNAGVAEVIRAHFLRSKGSLQREFVRLVSSIVCKVDTDKIIEAGILHLYFTVVLEFRFVGQEFVVFQAFRTLARRGTDAELVRVLQEGALTVFCKLLHEAGCTSVYVHWVLEDIDVFLRAAKREGKLADFLRCLESTSAKSPIEELKRHMNPVISTASLDLIESYFPDSCNLSRIRESTLSFCDVRAPLRYDEDLRIGIHWALDIISGRKLDTLVLQGREIPRLMRLLDQPHACSLDLALTAITRISRLYPALKAINDHMIGMVLKMIDRPDLPVYTAQMISRMLYHLCQYSGKLICESVAPYLMDLVRYRDSQVRADACWGISFWILKHPSRTSRLSPQGLNIVDIFIGLGFLDALKELLNSGDSAVTIAALRVSGIIATGSPSHFNAILKSGAVNVARRLLDHSDHFLIHAGVTFMARVSHDGTDAVQKSQLICAGVLQGLIEAVQTGKAEGNLPVILALESFVSFLQNDARRLPTLEAICSFLPDDRICSYQVVKSMGNIMLHVINGRDTEQIDNMFMAIQQTGVFPKIERLLRNESSSFGTNVYNFLRFFTFIQSIYPRV